MHRNVNELNIYKHTGIYFLKDTLSIIKFIKILMEGQNGGSK